MQSYIQVQFERMPHDPSVEAAAHRWVARLAATAPIHRAAVVLEPTGRRTAVSVWLELVDGATAAVSVTHGDVHVAVAHAFRAMQRRVIERPAAARRQLRVAFA